MGEDTKRFYYVWAGHVQRHGVSHAGYARVYPQEGRPPFVSEMNYKTRMEACEEAWRHDAEPCIAGTMDILCRNYPELRMSKG